MKQLFLIIALAITSVAFSQQKVGEDKKAYKLDEKYEFVTKIDTVKCSFLYVGDDGYWVSDRGFMFRSYLHCEKAKSKDVEITQIIINDKGTLIDPKSIIQVIQKDWKQK